MKHPRTILPLPPLLLLFALCSTLAAQTPEAGARVDQVFARWNSASTPGCAVGVADDGRTVLERAYGLADLEHDVPNTPATIFEAGSVSKQFTAAAIVLLALDGKLSLDDDVRKYVPELPDYGTPITIRHMMNHTSGLRDWGSVAGIGGWPRGLRVYTHDHVVDILSRQRALNFEPGDQYSYSNSGYNLQAVIVSRVSGMSFAEFSRTRIFEPLGMTNTQWRDDFRRIVKGRATAYAGRGDGFAIAMPFENVHGNGGLLTTVGDLLTWNESLKTAKLAGPEFVEIMHRRGVLNDGDPIGYASGLMVGDYNGVAEVSHTGSTGGYRAFLARYPEQDLSIALLCNIGSANPGGLGHDVADVFLGVTVEPQAAGGRRGGGQGGRGGRGGPAVAPQIPAERLAEYAGEYHSPDAESMLQLVVEAGQLIALRRPAQRITLRPTGEDSFNASGGLGSMRFIRDETGRVVQLSVRQSRVFDLRFDRVRR